VHAQARRERMVMMVGMMMMMTMMKMMKMRRTKVVWREKNLHGEGKQLKKKMRRDER
jgi:hypothetical protein